MKNTLIAILVIAIMIVGYLFIREKTKPTDYSNVWPETEPATPTNNQTATNNPTPNNTSTTACTPSSPASITILSPNGGETYYRNEVIDIKWKSCNVPGNIHLSGQLIDVDDNSGDRALFCEGGSSTWDGQNCLNSQGGRMVTPGAGTNRWEAGNYKVKLTSRDGVTISDSSNGLFVILPSDAPSYNFVESGDDVNGVHAGYIKSVSSSNGNYSLTIDYVILDKCPPIEPGDECLINNNTKLRTFQISSSADIKIFDDSMQPVQATLQSFKNVFSTEWAYKLNWITLEGGIITKISPIYLP